MEEPSSFPMASAPLPRLHHGRTPEGAQERTQPSGDGQGVLAFVLAPGSPGAGRGATFPPRPPHHPTLAASTLLRVPQQSLPRQSHVCHGRRKPAGGAAKADALRSSAHSPRGSFSSGDRPCRAVPWGPQGKACTFPSGQGGSRLALGSTVACEPSSKADRFTPTSSFRGLSGLRGQRTDVGGLDGVWLAQRCCNQVLQTRQLAPQTFALSQAKVRVSAVLAPSEAEMGNLFQASPHASGSFQPPLLPWPVGLRSQGVSLGASFSVSRFPFTRTPLIGAGPTLGFTWSSAQNPFPDQVTFVLSTGTGGEDMNVFGRDTVQSITGGF